MDSYRQAFGVRCCSSCSTSEEGCALISKTTATKRFHVTDLDLEALGSLSKANPHHATWAPTKLYMQSQVEALAHAKWGGAAGLAKRRRDLFERRTRARGVTGDAPDALSAEGAPSSKRRRQDGTQPALLDHGTRRAAQPAAAAAAAAAAADEEGEL